MLRLSYILFYITSAFAPVSALGCDCRGFDLQGTVAHSSAVFIGRVVDIQEVKRPWAVWSDVWDFTRDSWSPPHFDDVYLKVEIPYKGCRRGEVVRVRQSWSSDCSYNFIRLSQNDFLN